MKFSHVVDAFCSDSGEEEKKNLVMGNHSVSVCL